MQYHTFHYKGDKIKTVLQLSENLRRIHEGSAILKHAISEGLDVNKNERWNPFVPTHFIYCFFAYNSLYNIDWEISLSRGYLWELNTRKMSESQRQGRLLDFCFKDFSFVSIYSQFFIEYVLYTNQDVDIISELSNIVVDRSRNRNKNCCGAINDVIQIKAFQTACKQVFRDRNFTLDNIQTILDFIYKIRCNIFHGVKTLTDMKDEKQDIRLNIYASILIVINQMVFSYLDYLNGELDNEYTMRVLTKGVL